MSRIGVELGPELDLVFGSLQLECTSRRDCTAPCFGGHLRSQLVNQTVQLTWSAIEVKQDSKRHDEEHAGELVGVRSDRVVKGVRKVIVIEHWSGDDLIPIDQRGTAALLTSN